MIKRLHRESFYLFLELFLLFAHRKCCVILSQLNRLYSGCMKRTAPLMILLSVFALFGFGCTKLPTNSETDTTGSDVNPETQIDRRAVLLDAKQQGLIMDTPEIEQMRDPSVLVQDTKVQKNISSASLTAADLKTWPAAALADVTGGTSFGLVHARYQNGQFTLLAALGGLPAPQNGALYKGWLVKRGNEMRVLDTGRIEMNEKQFVNAYVSAEDFSTYDFFVITLQANAESSQPGEHILEGVIR